jgi:uncharacterized iron-regulated membrane protein
MSVNFRQSMTWLHRWAGILAGLVLYVVFVTGTFSYFRLEISHWMRPELGESQQHPDAVALAMRVLKERATDAPRWLIDVPDARRPTLRVGWPIAAQRGDPGSVLRRFESIEMNPATGEELHGRNTNGGDFFRRFHSELSITPVWGRWIVGACALSMLISLFSGVFSQRNIFRKLFTFRPGKGPRPWLDAHKLAGVFGLPYYAVIAYTGLVTLMLMYMPVAVDVNYRDDPGGFLSALLSGPEPSRATGRRSTLTDIAPLLEEASRRWNGATPASISIENPRDAGARITLRRADSGRISTNAQLIVFDGVSGEVLSATPDEPPALHTYGAMLGLHSARFSPATLRWVFACFGLLGAGMVGSGVMLWLIRRTPEDSLAQIPLIERLLKRLSPGVIVGIWWGVAAYFLANRLLPQEVAARPFWEIRCFFIAWALSIVAAMVQPSRWMWSTQFAVSALAFAALPLVNVVTSPVHFCNALTKGLWIYAGFDLAMLALAILFASVAAFTSPRVSLAHKREVT